jgi:hypothetical protein
LKERGVLALVPPIAVETIGLGGVSGMTALAQNTGRES